MFGHIKMLAAAGVLLDISHPCCHTERYHGDFPADVAGPKGGGNKNPVQGVGSTLSYARRYLKVLALDLKRRAVVWRYSQPDARFPYYSSAALDGGRVIVGGRDKSIHAIDTATGKAAWTFATRARVDSSPVVAGGRVYVGSADGRPYVLDSASGRKLWEFDTGAGITASPTTSGSSGTWSKSSSSRWRF